MKLDINTPNIESSADLESSLFSIGDTALILDILRTKLYSNPIGTICREYACNALDAHMEVGTPTKPIEISLPNILDSNYRIRDYGPGLSISRMEEVFTKYGTSTKRDTNEFIGAYGLGSKSFWSYCDSAIINTIIDNIKYSYTCFIDESRCGKLALLNKEKTSEPNGTEVVIPADKKDYKLFTTYTDQACRHWSVRPIIHGVLAWTEYDTIVEGKNWKITTTREVNNRNDNYYGYDSYNQESNSKVIISGIEYPINVKDIKNYTDDDFLSALTGNLFLYFDTGELSLSASREQLYYDTKTINALKKRLEITKKEVIDALKVKLDNIPDLYQAHLCYEKEISQVFYHRTHTSIWKTLSKWKDIELTNHINLNVNYSRAKEAACIICFEKGVRIKGKFQPEEISRIKQYTLYFNKEAKFLINDLSVPVTKAHIKHLFSDKIKQIQVVCPSPEWPIDKLNKLYHFDQMGPELVSKVAGIDPNIVIPDKKASKPKLLIYKLVDSHFRISSYDEMENDTKQKVLCIKNSDNSVKYKQKNIFLNIYNSECSKLSFYAVTSSAPADRVADLKMTSLESFIDAQLQSPAEPLTKIKYCIDNRNFYHCRTALNCLDDTKLNALLNDKNSLFHQRVAVKNEMNKISEKYGYLLRLNEAIGEVISVNQTNQFLKENPDFDLASLETKIIKKYPLLSHVSVYSIENKIAHYINLIDKEDL